MEGASGTQGNPVRVCVRGFTSAEQGDHFLRHLEGYPTIFLAKAPEEHRTSPSTVDHLLAVIRRDLRVTLFVNEIRISIEGRTATALDAGQTVGEDDLADIRRLRLHDVELPADAGILWVFSVGWRKGLFFDFMPLQEDAPPRVDDLEMLFGSYWAYVAQQHLFQLSEAAWERLYAEGWFPFIALSKSLIRNMATRACDGDRLDILLPKVHLEVVEKLPSMLSRWKTMPSFAPHIEILQRAAERFAEGDHISTTGLLYPRIEGLLRTVHEERAPSVERVRTRALTDKLVETEDFLHGTSWLLPARFRQYLNEFFFRGFAPGQPASLSRHSVSHGIAEASDFNEKAASIGFLILHQASYLAPRVRLTSRSTDAGADER